MLENCQYSCFYAPFTAQLQVEPTIYSSPFFPSLPPSARYDDKIAELEKKQEVLTAKLAALQQDYQQSLMKAGIVR